MDCRSRLLLLNLLNAVVDVLTLFNFVDGALLDDLILFRSKANFSLDLDGVRTFFILSHHGLHDLA